MEAEVLFCLLGAEAVESSMAGLVHKSAEGVFPAEQIVGERCSFFGLSDFMPRGSINGKCGPGRESYSEAPSAAQSILNTVHQEALYFCVKV